MKLAGGHCQVDEKRAYRSLDDPDSIIDHVTVLVNETETMIEPDGVADDLGREPIAVIAGGGSSSAYSASQGLNLTMPRRVFMQ